jgi:nicotinate-nucleotide adenylyltransferase
MKIGLYFGTFNPIHVGHLIIANHMAENSDLDQVWLVVTPHKKTPCSLQMYCNATEDFPKLKPSDIEFKLSQPNYTVNTLVHLEENTPIMNFR